MLSWVLVSIVVIAFIGIWKCLWLIVPFALYIFIFMIKLLEKTWIYKSLSLLGIISLESYLTNISLKSIFATLIPSHFTSSLLFGHYLDYMIVIVAGLFLAKIIHDLSQKIITSHPLYSAR